MGSQRAGHDWETELNWTELRAPSLPQLSSPPVPRGHLKAGEIFWCPPRPHGSHGDLSCHPGPSLSKGSLPLLLQDTGLMPTNRDPLTISLLRLVLSPPPALWSCCPLGCCCFLCLSFHDCENNNSKCLTQLLWEFNEWGGGVAKGAWQVFTRVEQWQSPEPP